MVSHGRRAWGALLICGVLSAASVAVRSDDAGRAVLESTGVAWQPDLRSAHKVAVRENKPLLLVFGADWCTFCKKLEQESLAHPALAQYINETFVPVHLDFDRDERVRDILEVERLPVTIVLTSDAEQLERFEGFQSAAEVYKKLAAAKQIHTQLLQTAGNVPVQ